MTNTLHEPMTATPLVTIAMPTFNRVTLLKRAVESARSQEYRNLDIVICDNASSDGTDEYCREVAQADERIRVVRHRENIGAAKNLSHCLGIARGDFFMWLADDDWIESGFVAACVRVLQAEPEAVLAAPAATHQAGDRVLFHEKPAELLASSPEKRVLGYFWSVKENSAFYGLYRLASVRDRRIAEHFGDDWVFVAQVVAAGKVVPVPGAVLHREQGGASSDLAELVRRTHVPALLSDRPYAVIAWNAARQILSGDGAYARLDFSRRIALATRASAAILGRFHSPKWYRHVPKKGRLKRFLGIDE
jgi:glycosyltransferase involved in cell wall biosynthesis